MKNVKTKFTNDIANLATLKEKVEDAVETNNEDSKDRDLTEDDVATGNVTEYKGKSRVWLMLLYPDCEEHKKIIEQIPTLFPSAVWINHDSDLTPDGKKKKEHIHYVIYMPNEVYKSNITKHFLWYADIDRFVIGAKDIKKRIRYLLHIDHPDKYQYPIAYLEGNVQPYLKYIDKEKIETEQAMSIILYLKHHTPWTRAEMIKDIIEMGCYSTFRRNAYMFTQVLDEQQMLNDMKRRNKGF